MDSTAEGKITERMVSMYEQRIENLQQENDKIRNKSLTRQIQIDEMKDQVRNFLGRSTEDRGFADCS